MRRMVNLLGDTGLSPKGKEQVSRHWVSQNRVGQAQVMGSMDDPVQERG